MKSYNFKSPAAPWNALSLAPEDSDALESAQYALFEAIGNECLAAAQSGDLDRIGDIYENHSREIEFCPVKLSKLPPSIHNSEFIECLFAALSVCPSYAFLLIHYIFTRNFIDITPIWSDLRLRQAMTELFTRDNIEPILFVATDIAQKSIEMRNDILQVITFEHCELALSLDFEDAVLALLSAFCSFEDLSDDVMEKILEVSFTIMKGTALCNGKLVHPSLFVRCADVFHKLSCSFSEFTEWAVEKEVDKYLGMMLEQRIKETTFETEDTLPYTIILLISDIVTGSSSYVPQSITNIISFLSPVEDPMRADKLALNERIYAILEEWLTRGKAVEQYHIVKNRHLMERLCDMCSRGPFSLRGSVVCVWSAMANRGTEELQDLIEMRCLEVATELLASESEETITSVLVLIERLFLRVNELSSDYVEKLHGQISPMCVSELIEMRDSPSTGLALQRRVQAIADLIGVD